MIGDLSLFILLNILRPSCLTNATRCAIIRSGEVWEHPEWAYCIILVKNKADRVRHEAETQKRKSISTLPLGCPKGNITRLSQPWRSLPFPLLSVLPFSPFPQPWLVWQLPFLSARTGTLPLPARHRTPDP